MRSLQKEKEDSRGGGGFGEPPFFISLFVLARWGHPPDAGWKDMTSCKKKKGLNGIGCQADDLSLSLCIEQSERVEQ